MSYYIQFFSSDLLDSCRSPTLIQNGEFRRKVSDFHACIMRWGNYLTSKSLAVRNIYLCYFENCEKKKLFIRNKPTKKDHEHTAINTTAVSKSRNTHIYTTIDKIQRDTFVIVPVDWTYVPWMYWLFQVATIAAVIQLLWETLNDLSYEELEKFKSRLRVMFYYNNHPDNCRFPRFDFAEYTN